MEVLLKSTDREIDVLFLAGEHSGDQHAASLLRELRVTEPDLRVAAIGGPALAAAGAESLYDLTQLSVIGLIEVLKHYGQYKQLMEETVAYVREKKPRVLVLVDYPGFNLRLAKRLFQEGLSAKGGGPTKLYYYIGPQLWAWKGHRRFAMAKHLDALAVIFPFEPEVYADTELPVTFVGHPFVGEGFELPFRFDSTGPVLLLPGSRLQPVRRILPVLLEGMARLRKSHPEETAVIVYPDEAVRALVTELVEASPVEEEAVALVPVGETVAAKAVGTSSGTASLAVALAGIPGFILYRTHPLTYLIGRQVVRVPYIGMANLILDKPVYPEFIQHEAKPSRLAQELAKVTRDEVRHQQMSRDATRLRALLSTPAGQSASDWLRGGLHS